MTELLCSRKACRSHADWAVLWNNPKLHTPDRRKTWLACNDHKEHLETFLSARSFWIETIPVEDLSQES
ncbi:MAG TPA: hypothetical protein VK054_13250 [Beutenbergiaceae bacterium]|nr:hypothetical protein [Beutenbergiaceae bacterium]